MSTPGPPTDLVAVPDAPSIGGLTFRHFRGESDFLVLQAIHAASSVADETDEALSLDDFARIYANLPNCDPYNDVLIVEMDGVGAAYTTVFWWDEPDSRIYVQPAFFAPAARGTGIDRAMLHYAERRLREIASGHSNDDNKRSKYFQAAASDTYPERDTLLREEGYTPVRHSFRMVRPSLNDILGEPSTVPLPEGLEVRPVEPEHYRMIYEAETEAFRDHWGVPEPQEGDFERWLNEPLRQPDLWQVAWDTQSDEVAGMVRNFINEEENTRYGRKRGYTESISVRRPWRRRGLAKALIARSFRILRDLGMTEAALGVDTQNEHGALQLYETMGFQVRVRRTIYRKPLA